MSSHGITIHPIFQRDPQLGIYTVTVPEFPGCISQGETLEEAREMIRQAAEGWLEAAHGVSPPIVLVEELEVTG